jgi:cobalamin biosynthesis protein CobW
MTQRTPATIITGFLGAGKTTLIRSLIENANGRRLALLINEFGDVGIDGDLLRSCGVPGCSDEDIVELTNGCICCTVADDFLPTLQKILARDPAPDHIVIETSGLALPQPLLRAFAWPEIKTRVTVDGVVTLVDAKAVAEGRFADDEDAVAAQRAADPNLDHESPLQELFEDQLSCADLVVLSKTDLVDADALKAVEAIVAQEKRPQAGVVRATAGRVPPSVIIGLGSASETDAENRRSHHDDEDHGAEDHDDFDSLVVSLPPAASADEVKARVAELVALDNVLRVKGFIRVAGKPARLVVQAAGPRIETYFDRPWRASDGDAGQLVVIGLKGLDHDAVRTIASGGGA